MKRLLNHNRVDDQRVVVTGMGVVTPGAMNLHDYYQDLMAGRSVIAHWPVEENSSRLRVSGDLKHFDMQSYFQATDHYSLTHAQLAQKLLRSTPLPGRLACIASLQAYYDAGFRDTLDCPERFGCVLGGHNFNNEYGYKNLITHRDTEPDYIEPLFGLIFLDTDILALNTELFRLLGPGLCVGNSFASSNTAILTATQLIKSGRADAVLVIGVSQEINFSILEDYVAKGLMEADFFHAEPERVSRPFDAKRAGLVPSQGAAAFVLEKMPIALKRDARIYAEILGGSLCMASAQHFYPTVQNEMRAMQQALKKAQVTIEEVDYINANADSSRLGDAIEVTAIKQLFHDKAYDIPINSTKSMLGHCFTASGAVECLAAILQMQHNAVHPTINQDERDPELDLNFVPNQGIDHQINIALSNSFGWGGFASSIVLGKV